MQNVFVYGTLRAGEINDINSAAARHDIAAPTFIGSTTVKGRLYDFGSYPGLVVDQRGTPVVGDVYEIEDALIAVLDEIEEIYPGVEGLFRNRDVMVEVDGAAVPCRFYPVARESVAGLTEIVCGDWIAHRLAR